MSSTTVVLSVGERDIVDGAVLALGQGHQSTVRNRAGMPAFVDLREEWEADGVIGWGGREVE